MKYRKLRIAWSVACWALCVGIVVNWIVMYNDSWGVGLPVWGSTSLTLDCYRARVAIAIRDATPADVLWELHRGPNATQPTGFPIGFEFVGRPLISGMAVVIPYWFLIALAAVAGVGPWWPAMRRFSLRTLLIAATLIAVLLGIVAMLRGS